MLIKIQFKQPMNHIDSHCFIDIYFNIGLIRPIYAFITTGYGQKDQNGRKRRGGGGKEQNGASGDGSFMVPRSIELSLSSAPVALIDVLPLRFYADFVFLLDFAICTAIG